MRTASVVWAKPLSRVKMAGVAVIALASAACAEPSDTPTSVEPSIELVSVGNLRSIRPGERAMAEIAGVEPSFAGYFLEGDKLVLHVNNPSRGEAVRALARSPGGANGQDIRELARGRAIEIREVAFSYAQLNDWRNQAFNEVFRFEDVVSLDLDEVRNRVVVGLESGADLNDVEAMFESMGVPREAYGIDITGPIVSTTAAASHSLLDWNSSLQGGIVIAMQSGGGCTLGFNAVMAGDTVFFMNSHCGGILFQLDPNSVYQNIVLTSRHIGYEFADPEGWMCLWYVECRYSDAAAFSNTSNPRRDASLGIIVRTTFRTSAWGEDGSLTLDHDNPFRIDGTWNYPPSGLVVQKIGIHTGWTFGTVQDTCVDQEAGYKMKLCSYSASLYNEPGDSGSPIFFGWGTDPWDVPLVQLTGIHYAQQEGAQKAWFSPWGGIVQDFGSLDVLAPAPPPPSNPIQVTIEGPTEAPEHAAEACMWTANTTGGSGSTSYQWTYDEIPVGTDFQWSGDTGTTGFHDLTVTVTDATGSDYDELTIEVSEFAECFQ